ncbi:50S ribosomal protein L25 [Candidatus Saccharibacteria bacterium]|nr:50S ribosomal protein L25 [Candidatus Saccharibacteria bacterium]
MSNSEYKLELSPRTLQGKKLAKLRAEGLIPSTVYGGKKTVLTASPYNPTEKVLREAGYHSPVELSIENHPQLAVVKTVQVDPVSRRIISVEFQAISASAAVEVTTPIKIVGFETSDASKAHLSILQVVEEIDVKGKPADLPKEIELDASTLKEAGDKLTLNELKLPKGVEVADKELESDLLIANVYDPAAEAAAREAEDEAAKAAEPVSAADVPADNGQKPEAAAEEAK